MKVKDPHDLISQVDLGRFNLLKGMKIPLSPNVSVNLAMSMNYVEPNISSNEIPKDSSSFQAPSVTASPRVDLGVPEKPVNSATGDNVLKGRIQSLGDYIDTDAVCMIPLTSGFKTHLTNRHTTSAGTSKLPCRKQNQ
jgi:hypothetical protein